MNYADFFDIGIFFFQKLVLTTCLDRLFRPPPLLDITADGHETRYVTRGHPGTDIGVRFLRDRQKGAGLEAKEGKNGQKRPFSDFEPAH